MQYADNKTMKMENTTYMLFNFSSLTEQWGFYWNHTEVNIKGIFNKHYKVLLLKCTNCKFSQGRIYHMALWFSARGPAPWAPGAAPEAEKLQTFLFSSHYCS